MSKCIYSLLPVVPAPVYAIRHLLVDNSHNFIKESFPEDSKYWNPKLYDYSIRLRDKSISFHGNLHVYKSYATLPSELLPCRSSWRSPSILHNRRAPSRRCWYIDSTRRPKVWCYHLFPPMRKSLRPANTWCSLSRLYAGDSVCCTRSTVRYLRRII